MRAQAARALGERAVPIAVEPLVKRLKDGEPSVRLQAVIALGRIGRRRGDSRSVAAGGRDGHIPGLFGAAGAASGSATGRPPPEGLDSPDPKVRAGTLLAMEQVYDVAASSRLADSPRRPSGRSKSGSRHRISWPRSIARRPRGTASGGALSRPSSKPPARTIAWDGTPRVMATIRELVDGDPSPAIRIAAVEALAADEPDESPSFLRGLFPREKDPGVKRAIALALGKLADTRSARPPDRRRCATLVLPSRSATRRSRRSR